MKLVTVLDAFFGDSGKARIAHFLASFFGAKVVARCSGGDNAGHTVVDDRGEHKLNILPCGALMEGVTAVLGNGMVVNPRKLLDEMKYLSGLGIDFSPGKIFLSHAAHIILPTHAALDKMWEQIKSKNGNAIGTTGRGIGPAYCDKMSRTGLRAELMRNPDQFAGFVCKQVEDVNTLLSFYDQPMLDPKEIAESYYYFATVLRHYVTDTSRYLNALPDKHVVVVEGAQGTLLDIDHGTYPKVTSSSCTIGGVFTGLGVSPKHLWQNFGVVKAFGTRVGEGPFPTEVFGAELDRLRGIRGTPGAEYGVTTGRPRRCGWLDLESLQNAVRINGFDGLAITKLDTLSGLEKVKVCTGYQYKEVQNIEGLQCCQPVYREMEGWPEDIRQVRSVPLLPQAAQDYVRFVEESAGTRVGLISVGPAQNEIIVT